jgi:hypothetical protein
MHTNTVEKIQGFGEILGRPTETVWLGEIFGGEDFSRYAGFTQVMGYAPNRA